MCIVSEKRSGGTIVIDTVLEGVQELLIPVHWVGMVGVGLAANKDLGDGWCIGEDSIRCYTFIAVRYIQGGMGGLVMCP